MLIYVQLKQDGRPHGGSTLARATPPADSQSSGDPFCHYILHRHRRSRSTNELVCKAGDDD
jgi:hypothetical protein